MVVEGGDAAPPPSPPPQLELFLSIGLDKRTAENALVNNKVTANLTAVIKEAGVHGCSKAIGNLLYTLEVRRCHECGQPLSESYEPPADEPWTTGICGCAEDTESCWTGLFCPCVLFGRNVESLREDIPWTQPCICHAIFVEGGMALAAATAIFHGIDPRTSFLIGEGILFAWWMCGIYTGLFRQSLQKKYHLKITSWKLSNGWVGSHLWYTFIQLAIYTPTIILLVISSTGPLPTLCLGVLTA